MAHRIHILSDQTINQIAAGEVIENPASVVKELFENAVDAGASHIAIEILGGGFQSIRISDNGSGMSDADALLCLKRYATSKIASAEDLMQLQTMGFRGEALASIAAISSVILTTSVQDGYGVQIQVKGGEVVSVQPSARAKGTTIEVHSLFYNVPARKKFQKTAIASSAEITRIASSLALAHPYIGIELIQQRKTIFSFSAAQKDASFLALLQKRSAELLGAHFESHMHTIHFQENGCIMHGLIGGPRITRYNRSGQHLYVNNRPVHCMPFTFAIRDGYGTRLDSTRHPIYVIHIEIDPSLIDVNVHPQKKEIRLREEERMKATMRTAVQRALQSLNHLVALEIDIPAAQTGSMPSEARVLSPTALYCAEKRTSSSDVYEKQTQFLLQQEIKVIGLFKHFLLIEASSLSPRLFGPLSSEGVIWIDLLAAEARILFERLMSTYGKQSSQSLLLPITFSCSNAEAERLLCSLNELNQLGMQLRSIGPTVFIIEAIPACLEEKEIANVLHAIASSLTDDSISNSDTRIKRCAQMICQKVRSCVKTFSLSEALHLVKELTNTCNALHCPQGKPTFYHQKTDAIERYFQS